MTIFPPQHHDASRDQEASFRASLSHHLNELYSHILKEHERFVALEHAEELHWHGTIPEESSALMMPPSGDSDSYTQEHEDLKTLNHDLWLQEVPQEPAPLTLISSEPVTKADVEDLTALSINDIQPVLPWPEPAEGLQWPVAERADALGPIHCGTVEASRGRMQETKAHDKLQNDNVQDKKRGLRDPVARSTHNDRFEVEDTCAPTHTESFVHFQESMESRPAQAHQAVSVDTISTDGFLVSQSANDVMHMPSSRSSSESRSSRATSRASRLSRFSWAAERHRTAKVHQVTTHQSFGHGHHGMARNSAYDLLREDVVKNYERRGSYHLHHGSLWRNFINNATFNNAVKTFMTLAVVSNSVVLGFQAGSSWKGWLWVDLMYAIVFFLEIVYKFASEGFFFILPINPEYRWSLFDILLMLLSIFDVIATAVFREDGGGNSNQYTWMRIARLVRLARILRLLQLDVFGDLLLMINGAIGGLRTLGWSLVMITVPLYVFALFYTEMIGQYVDYDSDTYQNVAEHFSSMGRSMFTGFRCLVQSDCTAMNGTPIFPHLMKEYGWFYGLVYALTSVCMSFGLFNVIISIYVENTVAAAKSNEIVQRQRRLSDSERFTEKILNFTHFLWAQFRKPGVRRTGFKFEEAMNLEVSEDMFMQIVDLPEMSTLLSELDVPKEDHMDLFDICDADASGMVSMDELVAGIKRLRGDPRRSDIVYVMLRVRDLQMELHRMRTVFIKGQHPRNSSQSVGNCNESRPVANQDTVTSQQSAVAFAEPLSTQIDFSEVQTLETISEL